MINASAPSLDRLGQEPGPKIVAAAVAQLAMGVDQHRSSRDLVLELARGDGARPYTLGLSEAQWSALVTAVACVAWQPGFVTGALVGGLCSAAVVLVRRRGRRELLFPSHLFELDRALRSAGDGARHETSLGVAVSRFVLPDGRTDWILSSEHRHWSEPIARRLAHHLWPSFELVPGRAPGVFHAIVN